MKFLESGYILMAELDPHTYKDSHGVPYFIVQGDMIAFPDYYEYNDEEMLERMCAAVYAMSGQSAVHDFIIKYILDPIDYDMCESCDDEESPFEKDGYICLVCGTWCSPRFAMLSAAEENIDDSVTIC